MGKTNFYRYNFKNGNRNGEIKGMYEAVVTGSGPAGLSAALYLKRAGKNVIVIEKEYEGTGQITQASALIITWESRRFPGRRWVPDSGSRFWMRGFSFWRMRWKGFYIRTDGFSVFLREKP